MLLHDEDEARAYVVSRFSAESIAKLDRFLELLVAASATQNLVSKASLSAVWLRHIADSVQLIDYVSRGTSPWVDLGSGAGFPGLVVSIVQPERQVILIESRRLRIEWLNDMKERLGLRKCLIVGGDVRQVDRIDAAVLSARAFAPLPRLIEISARFSTAATEWVLPKGKTAAQDVATLPHALQKRFHVKHSVTDPNGRILIAKGKLGAAT